MKTKLAKELIAGDVIVKAGRTPHFPITVTSTNKVRDGLISVHGFNNRNKTPRLMFRHLEADLSMVLEK